MIHLVNASNRHLYDDTLLAMHRERHRQFVVERGWALRSQDGLEIDDYDDDKAQYLIGYSTEGDIEVGCRLRPTATGGVLPDIFPHLVADTEGPIRAPGVFECTRYFATPGARGRAGFEARSKLHLAMLELVRDQGGHRLLGFVDLPFLTHLRRFSGLRIRPIGFPAPYDDGGVAIAFEIGVDDADLTQTRQRLGIPDRQLFVAPPWLPQGADVLAIAQSTAVLLYAPERRRDTVRSILREAASDVVLQPDVDALMARLAESVPA